MPQLARDLVRRGLYGIPSTAMLRHKVHPGDRVFVTVGSPHRMFAADAVIASGYHRFSEEERARRPEWMDLDHGFSLRDVRAWTQPVPIMSVWPETVAGASTNKTALFYGTLITLKPGDDMVILAAAARAAGAGPANPSDADRDRTASSHAGVARRTRLAAHSNPVQERPEEASARVQLALARAERSPRWLPDRVAHADWGTAPAKRAVASGRAARRHFSRARPFGVRGHRAAAGEYGAALRTGDDAPRFRFPDRASAPLRGAGRR
jgi:hypothetical protein